MKKKRFKGELLSGHKDDAIKVPFDPSIEWKVEAKSLWRGRRGFRVIATINRLSFESAIAPRQKKFYLLIGAEAKQTAALWEGSVIQVAVELYDE